jgi:hypothetical protein
MSLPRNARIAAGLIALVGLSGLAIQFSVSLGKSGTVPAALWAMLRFFTIIGNTLTAGILTATALGSSWAARPVRLGGITLLMALIGIVYALLLRNVQHLTGAAYLATALLHYLVPPLVALFWLVFAPKGGSRLSHPPRWAVLPLVYFAYALIRAGSDGTYPYPFIDVAKLGWPQVLVNALAITLVFLAAGYALVWLDKRMSSKAAGS